MTILATLFDLSAGALAVGFISILLLYYSGLAIHRLYFSPLAKFPGPRLAAVTYWYEGYYDIVKRGKYIFKIRDLHAQYGNTRQLHEESKPQVLILT